MKRNFKQHALRLALVSAFAIGGAAVGVNSYAVDGTAAATATVVTPITITKVNDLRFGSFSTSAVSQTVTIAGTSAGTRTNSGAVLLNSTNGSASFTVSGTADQTYSITIPTAAVTITTGDGAVGKTMSVASFTSTPTAGTGTGLLTGGTQTLYVGATVTTVASQVAGIYTGNFTVTVAYN